MTVININNFDNPELSVYAALNETALLRYFEPQPGLFIAESPLVIERALEAGYEPVSVLAEEDTLKGDAGRVLMLLEEKWGNEIPLYTAQRSLLTRITGYELTRGMLCAMKRKVLPSAAELLSRISSGRTGASGADTVGTDGCTTYDMRRIAVLDNVQNPTNVGAIIRSAAALGMDAVLLTNGCADPLFRRAVRVSMGTVFKIPWTFMKDYDELETLGYKTAAMALKENSLGMSDQVLKSEEKLAVVLGSEGYGLTDEVIGRCDYTVMIPMYHGVDSLNVAAASAVAFWELGKRYGTEDTGGRGLSE